MTLESSGSTTEKLKRARRVAIVLATSTVISSILLVYAHVKSIEAEQFLDLSVEVQQQNEKLKMELEQAKQISVAARHEAIIQRDLAQKALEECVKNKKQ